MLKKNKKDISYYYPLFFTIIFVLVMLQYSFSALEGIFYDLAIQYDGAKKDNPNIVVITLDEESDDFLGDTFPYTYATHAKFLKNLLQGNPLVVVYTSPMKHGQKEDLDYQQEIAQMIANFKKLGRSFYFDKAAWQGEASSFLEHTSYYGNLVHVPYGNLPEDGVLRTAILNIRGEDSLHLKVANTYRSFYNQEPIFPKDFKGGTYLRELEATVIPFRFYTSPADIKTSITSIPLHKVANGNIPNSFFQDKIVVIGSHYISKVSDYVKTSFTQDSSRSSALNVHAAIINAFLNKKTVFRTPDLVTQILSVLIALFLSMVVSRIKPTKGLILIALMIMAVFLITYVTFCLLGIWINIAHMLLTIFVVYYIWVPFRAIGEYQQRYAIQEESKILKKVDKLKHNFISLMSHDLKTPVAKIAGIADILGEQYDNSKEQEKHIADIMVATRDLNKFITSILDLAKVESDDLNLRKSSKDLNKIIEDVIAKLRFEASRSEIQMDVKLSPLYPI
ncbi:MAG: CHASE2 domain-containing protein, partial [Bacteriovoracaceae bacterium]|nr:CHASE2 domain-containing protein [Bacteriovoracaceae bacterium]